MPTRNHRPAGAFALLAAVAGALVAAVLGLLTFGAQATVAPESLPLAVAAPPGPLQAAAKGIASQGGDQVSWRVTSPEEGRKLLEDKEVYGVLELPVKVVVSGAVNPSGTQIAHQVLTGAAQALGRTPEVETLHPVGAAGRVVPLALSALAWVGCLAAGAALILAGRRIGREAGIFARFTQIVSAGVLVTGVLAGFLKLWDSSLPLGWDVLAFLFLISAAFAALQTGLLRLLGIRAMVILGPLYLVAPTVAGQVPELLNPAYRAVLWSWTPFRFSAEGLRSLLQGVPGAPDVATGVWVLAGLLAAGPLLAMWPGRSALQKTEADTPDRVVQVGVH
ncbi:ABC transporter permease [Amycolatopsis sp. QT-25]|uniref:ABC transporter permease n=1 Tax=Amycolatopsis sp. QT-25 TaxID=3034022 RepID=UPI0023EE0F1A|nr:ABC transporter permease [Amycolatopsis sp. QT-25]WET77684.1 ABC transporter permease [Amycolatopsis sp. QT-25]